MASLPYTHLRSTQNYLVAVSGPHVQLFDLSTSDLISSQKLSSSGPIRCLGVDSSQTYLATSSDDKILHVWNLKDLTSVNQRELPKKPTEILFTPDSKAILVSDKFGDVFSYPVHLPEGFAAAKTEAAQRDPNASHENPSNGQLILGHVSVLNTFLLSQNQKYIITADRDEHVRVSRFPNGYNIEAYCFGHQTFVSALHLSPSKPDLLISGGGDPTLKLWKWIDGSLLHEVEIWSTLQKYIKASSPESSEEGEGQGKGRHKKKKGKAAEASKDASEEPAPADAEPTPTHQPAPPVLVVHAIRTLNTADGPYVVVSAVGCSALLAFPLTFVEPPSAADMVIFDCEQPVLDFTIHDQHILVSTHATWSKDPASNTSTTLPHIRHFTLSPTQFVEAEQYSKLCSTLNTSSLIPGSAEDFKSLDLYSRLSSMPKRAEHIDAMDRDALLTEMGSEKTQKLTKKELGRLKSKIALSTGGAAEQTEDKSPQAKRLKSESSSRDEDEEMQDVNDK